MSKGTLQIHSENILPIIKKWLYSDRDIFVRELVSNACDALHKVKVLQDQGVIQKREPELRLDIEVDKEKRTLTFRDTGIGMDADEVVRYIAQIAFSSAEEFVQKYQSSTDGDAFIGHFGLGFYSAYMAAEKVTIDTLSYKEGAEPVFWSCDGSQEYEMGMGSRKERGTTITLYIDKDHDEFLEASHVRHVLTHYCSFLPYPIYLGGDRINEKDPLWIKTPSECQEKDYLDFYRHLYPGEQDPLFWIHLNVDYPFHLKGILYFPHLSRPHEMNKKGIKLYCNRVFVSDNCKDLIPEYLMLLHGVIDSPDIPLNVSRSSLQMDKTVRQLAGHISKKVADSLNSLYKSDKERFLNSWQDLSGILKFGAMEDDKFYERVKGLLIWKTTDGEWLTAEEYLERYRDLTKDRLFYTRDPAHLTPLATLYREKGIALLCADQAIDPFLMQHIERNFPPAKFQRLDAAVDDLLLDKEREQTLLDAEGRTPAGRLADLVRRHLDHAHVEVEAKSLAGESLPGLVVIDEQQRRFRDYMAAFQNDKSSQAAMAMLGKRTFVLNTNNPLVALLPQIDSQQPELAKELVQQLYELALLAQREIAPESLSEFTMRTTRILEQLATKALASGNVPAKQAIEQRADTTPIIVEDSSTSSNG